MAVCLALAAPSGASAQRRACGDPLLPGGTARRGAFRFDAVRPGVYQAVATGAIEPANRPVVIVNDTDVVVVDPTTSAAAACALIEDIKTITPKPIRAVINTHFHFDHTNGNEVFGPDVELIGHEFTRATIASGGSTSGRAVDYLTRAVNGLVASLTRQLDTLTNAARRDTLARRVTNWRAAMEGARGAVATPPTRGVADELTLARGSREIRLLHPGPGHTGGDLVVLLPRERVLLTGDLLQAGVPYLGDGHFPQWVEALERLKALDFDVVIPGHQPPFTDRARIEYLQDYLRDLWAQASALHAAGVSAADAARRIDLRRHAPRLAGAGASGVDPTATARLWELLDGKR